MPHQNLPKELEEEFEGQLYDFFDDNQLLEAVYEKPKMETIKSFLLKVYRQGYIDGEMQGVHDGHAQVKAAAWDEMKDYPTISAREWFLRGREEGMKAGYKDGILGAMEEAPTTRAETADFSAKPYIQGWNAYRSELLSRLEERLNDGVQE